MFVYFLLLWRSWKVRENLFKKYGHYENKHDDKTHCLTLLELYQKTELNQMNQNFDELPVNVNPIKSYPFAFNSYNLDEEKPKVRIKKSSHSRFFIQFVLFYDLRVKNQARIKIYTESQPIKQAT
jgi:hypothetical protein